MKRGYKKTALVIGAVTAVSFEAICPILAVDNQVDMFRLYNPNSGEHFYTASNTEKDSLVFRFIDFYNN